MLLNNSNLPLVIIDSQNIIIQANNNFLNLTGYDFKILNKIKIEAILNFEKNILKCIDNKQIPVEYKVFTIKSLKNNEKVILIKSLKELIDAEIKKETAYDFHIKYSKFFNLFQELLNIYPKGLVLINHDGKIDNTNRKFKEIFYIDGQNEIYNNILVLFKKLEIISQEDYNNLFLEKNINIINLLDKISKKSFKYNENYYFIEYKKFNTEENYETKYLLIFSDISDVNRLKDDIKKKVSLIRKFFNNIYFPMCITDMEGFIKDVNPAFKSVFNNYENKSIFFLSKILCGIYKKNQKELFKNKVVFLGDFIVCDKNMEIINKVDIKNKNLRTEIINRCSYSNYEHKGSHIYSIYCYFLFNNFNYSIYDSKYSILFIFIDRTEIFLKKIELLDLIENSKNLSNRIDVLFNNINHEMRTPINIINGFIELLKYENIGQENQKNLESIINNIENINEIIQEVISITSYSGEDKNIDKINIIPIFNDYKSYIERECKFRLKTNVFQIKNLNIKINIFLFKKLFYFLMQNFKNYENLEFGIYLENLESINNFDKTNIILYLKEFENKNDFSFSSQNNEIIKIILNYMIFLLSGDIKYGKSNYDIRIKIPIKIVKD